MFFLTQFYFDLHKPILKETHFIQQMNILLLAPSYLDLYKPILNGLKEKGHKVTWIEDEDLLYSYKRKDRSFFFRIIKYAVSKLKGVERKHWRKYQHLLSSQSYDLLFVINGCSYCNFVLNQLLKVNPNVRKVLYIWDTCKYFDYLYYKRHFDKIYSFDYEDSLNNSDVTFLPFYWVPSTQEKAMSTYDISLIGSDHDNRLQIVNAILPQLQSAGIKYYIKIVANAYSTQKEEYSDILVHEKISIDEIYHIMSSSNCILDTDRETQTGTTPRVIWALAMGKKIVSTNKNLKRLDFINQEQLYVFDRYNPQLDIEFIKSNSNFPVSDYVNSLQISKWLDNFLS